MQYFDTYSSKSVTSDVLPDTMQNSSASTKKTKAFVCCLKVLTIKWAVMFLHSGALLEPPTWPTSCRALQDSGMQVLPLQAEEAFHVLWGWAGARPWALATMIALHFMGTLGAVPLLGHFTRIPTPSTFLLPFSVMSTQLLQKFLCHEIFILHSLNGNVTFIRKRHHFVCSWDTKEHKEKAWSL